MEIDSLQKSIMKKFLIALIVIFLLSSCGAKNPPDASTAVTPGSTVTSIIETTSSETLQPAPTATEVPEPTLTPTAKLAEYDVFIKYTTNMYEFFIENYDDEILDLVSLEFVENPDGDLTLLAQVRGDITESTKSLSFVTFASVIGKQLDETTNKVPERLRLFVVEFFDSNENYFTNYGIKWSDLREQINNNFEGIRGVLRIDINNYKK